MTRLMFTILAGMMLAFVTDQNSVTAADAILLNFSSPHCAPCQAMQPTLAQLERAGVPIRHIDVTAEPGLAARYGIRKTPTFVVVSGGKELTRLAGSQTLASLRAALATDLSGPLIPTRARSRSLEGLPAPQTRLAPVGRLDPAAQSFASINGPSSTGIAADRGRLDTARSEPMPSVSLADAVERARAATVRLRVHDGHGYGAGTGTIIDVKGEEALVLTCGHLFRETKGEGKIEVDLFVGGQTKTVAGEVFDYDSDERDIALVIIRPGFAVQPVQVIQSGDRVRNGQSSFSFGCDRGDDPSRRDTRITGINKYNQHLGVSNLEIAGAPIDGRSGGGLFDAQGRLIGVCNAADYKGDVGIYSGPGNIHWQLDRAGLVQLYRSPGSPAGGVPNERLASLNPAGVPKSMVQTSALGAPELTAAPKSTPANATLALAPASPSPASPSPAALSPAALSPASLSSAAMPLGNQEVIVIVRDRNNPEATSRVMTLDNPSADLMQLLERQAR